MEFPVGDAYDLWEIATHMQIWSLGLQKQHKFAAMISMLIGIQGDGLFTFKLALYNLWLPLLQLPIMQNDVAGEAIV